MVITQHLPLLHGLFTTKKPIIPPHNVLIYGLLVIAQVPEVQPTK